MPPYDTTPSTITVETLDAFTRTAGVAVTALIGLDAGMISLSSATDDGTTRADVTVDVPIAALVAFLRDNGHID